MVQIPGSKRRCFAKTRRPRDEAGWAKKGEGSIELSPSPAVTRQAPLPWPPRGRPRAPSTRMFQDPPAGRAKRTPCADLDGSFRWARACHAGLAKTRYAGASPGLGSSAKTPPCSDLGARRYFAKHPRLARANARRAKRRWVGTRSMRKAPHAFLAPPWTRRSPRFAAPRSWQHHTFLLPEGRPDSEKRGFSTAAGSEHGPNQRWPTAPRTFAESA